jgi:hypothetical protein
VQIVRAAHAVGGVVAAAGEHGDGRQRQRDEDERDARLALVPVPSRFFGLIPLDFCFAGIFF